MFVHYVHTHDLLASPFDTGVATTGPNEAVAGKTIHVVEDEVSIALVKVMVSNGM